MATTEAPRAAIATAVTATNRSIEIHGATLVYRRFGGGATDAPPLVCLQYPEQFADHVHAFLNGG